MGNNIFRKSISALCSIQFTGLISSYPVAYKIDKNYISKLAATFMVTVNELYSDWDVKKYYRVEKIMVSILLLQVEQLNRTSKGLK
jgi:hypothetical protein